MSGKGVDNVSKTIRALVTSIGVGINVAQLARVVRKHGNTADIQPLAKNSEGEKRSMILGALMLKGIPEDVDVGDDVLVVFLDRDSDNYNGGVYSLSSKRLHSVNDAVIVGVIA